MATSIHAGGSVQKRLRFVLVFCNQATMALIENGANVDCPNAKRLVRYLRLRNLLQHFLFVKSIMYALQLRYLGNDAVDDCESGGKYCSGSSRWNEAVLRTTNLVCPFT
jgi:hypothetical protein